MTNLEIANIIINTINNNKFYVIIGIIFTLLSILEGMLFCIKRIWKVIIKLVAAYHSYNYYVPDKFYPEFDSLHEMELWFLFLDNVNKSFEDIWCEKHNITETDSDRRRYLFYRKLSNKTRKVLLSLSRKNAIYADSGWGGGEAGFHALYISSVYTDADFSLIGRCSICQCQIEISLEQFKTEKVQESMFPKKQPLSLNCLDCKGYVDMYIENLDFIHFDK